MVFSEPAWGCHWKSLSLTSFFYPYILILLKTLYPYRKFYAFKPTKTGSRCSVFKFLFTLFILVFGHGQINAQATFERHLIIAYNSVPFIKCFNRCAQYKNCNRDLFLNYTARNLKGDIIIYFLD